MLPRRSFLPIAALGLLAGVSSIALADAPPPAEHTFTSNVGLVSDYRFRGISQTFRLPAIQGGFDYAHVSGFYLGTWGSNVSGLQYSNGADLEWDIYGGFKNTLANDVSYDVGLLQYYYPGSAYNGSNTKYNTLELYGAVSYKNFSVKYSHTLTDFFGVKTATYGGVCGANWDTTTCFSANPGNSKGSGYLEANGSFDLGNDVSLSVHLGHQSVHHYSALNYSDFKLGVNKLYNGFNFGAAFVTTDAKKGFYNVTDGNGDNKVLSGNTLILSVSRSF